MDEDNNFYNWTFNTWSPPSNTGFNFNIMTTSWWMYCPNCNSNIEYGFKFCSHCGYDLNTVPEVSNQEVIDKLDDLIKEINNLKKKLIKKEEIE